MFKDMYKQSVSKLNCQESRRNALLREHKEKRMHLQDKNRMKATIGASATKKNHKRKSPRTFGEKYEADLKLQLSEWMRERPEELSDWLLVPCPCGQRCMVVAHGGRTEMYNKSGRLNFAFNSLLPGGGPFIQKSITILDCVYTQRNDEGKEGTFYVLDALVYNNQDLVGSEAKFRFFWIRSKITENEELGKISARNEKYFFLLEHYDFENTQQISEALQRYPVWQDNSPELDGFLFYHKEASYTSGTTPLVVWLYAYMVPELLGLQISSNYKRPSEYVDALQYMDEFDNQLKQKMKRLNAKKKLDTANGSTITSRMNEEDVEDSALLSLVEAERKLEMEDC